MREITYTDLMVMDLQNLPGKIKELEKITNPLEKQWRQRQIADVERLLVELDETERFVVDEVVIKQGTVKLCADALAMTNNEVRCIRDYAISHLCSLRYGAAYRP